MILRIMSVLLLCSLVVTGVAASSSTNVCIASGSWSMSSAAAPSAAQTETPTSASSCLAPDAITAARAACDSSGVGQVCLGAGSVQASPGNNLTLVGEAVDFSGITSLTSTSGSLALLKMQADLPATAAPIQIVLYGDASIANTVTGLQPPFPTITVINGPANILNLRATPSATAAVVTTMKWGEQLTADGRSSDGQWYRVQTDQGAAWVFASLIKVKAGDDPGQLYVLDSASSQPTQSLTLQNSAESCGGGLLVQAANHEAAHLHINGALLTFSTATLLLQAQPDKTLDVLVVSGSADLSASGTTVTAKTGAEAQVALTSGQASAAPQLQDHYAFASLIDTPLDLLPTGSLSCVAGVSSGSAALYTTPGAAQSSASLDSTSSVTATGQTTIAGKTWLLVGSNWVPLDDVQTAGVCDALPQVSPATSQQQVSQPSQTSFAHDLLPTGRSIWQAHTGVDNLTGTCISPPIAQCDHLAAVTTQANGTITWLGQEPAPYTMHPTAANTFSFSGRNQLNSANLSLSVTFTSATTWVGTMHLVYDNDSGCTHTFNYTADRLR